MVVFFNDTATTECYTYLHTLSLHDALPIAGCRVLGCGQDRDPRHGRPLDARGPSRTRGRAVRLLQQRFQRDRRSGRSEEHTSELQSLMRISYAVFCLKKKTTNKNKQNYYIELTDPTPSM